MQRSLEAATVTRRSLRERILANFPDLTEDAETLADTLSGLDGFEEECIAVLRYAIEREATARALGELIDGMTARKRRLEEGAKNLRGEVLQAMRDAGLSKIRAPDIPAIRRFAMRIFDALEKGEPARQPWEHSNAH